MENDKIEERQMEIHGCDEDLADYAEDNGMVELTEEEKNIRKLEEENERLRQEIERVRSLPLKERLYDKVNVSVRTLDIFIAVMIIFGIIVVVLGMR